MTRKDYKIIAGALNHVYKMVKPQEGEGNEEAKKQIEIVKTTVDKIGEALQSDNYRFDWIKFEQAVYQA